MFIFKIKLLSIVVEGNIFVDSSEMEPEYHFGWELDCSVHTLRLRENGCHFADNILKYIFMNENLCILIPISLKFVPKRPVDSKSLLVQLMAWHRTGIKPLSELMIV